MPVTKVKAPSGEIIQVQHPDGASEAEIIKFAQASRQQSHAPTTQAGPTVPGFVKDQFNQFKEDVAQAPRAPGMVMDYVKQNKEPLMKMLPDIAATALTLTPWGAPMAPAKAANFVASKTPAALPLISDLLMPMGLDILARKGAATLATNAIRFAPSIAASGIGGAGGAVVRDLNDKKVLSELKDEPTEEQIKTIFDRAAGESGRQMMLEIGGDAVYRGFEKLFLPNAELLTQEGERVIRFARENKLPLLPGTTTGTKNWAASIIESFAPSGYVVKQRTEAMAKLLEAPVEDSSAFIWKLMQQEGKDISKEAATNPKFRSIVKIIQDSMDDMTGLQKISNQKAPGMSGYILNGSKLLKNLQGADKWMDKESLVALENLALYAKAVHRDINQFALGSASITKGFQAVPQAVNVATTGLILAPLVTSYGQERDQPSLKIGPIDATVGETAVAIAAFPIAAFLADSITNPRSNLFRWVTTGAVDGKILKNMIRADMTATGRMLAREQTGKQELDRTAMDMPSKPPNSFPDDLGFDPLMHMLKDKLKRMGE